MKKEIKKLLVLTMVLVLFLQAMPMVNAENGSEKETMDRSGTFVVVRTVFLLDSNSNDANIIATLSPGTRVTGSIAQWSMTSTSKMQVTYGSNTGYVVKNTICPANRCYKVSASNFTVLWETNTLTGNIVCQVPYGTYMCYLSTSNGAYRVYTMPEGASGQYGYVDPAEVTPG